MRFALLAVRAHKLRASLTVLGIVVGVATVIAMVSIVTGFNNNMVRNFQSFGASLVLFQKYEPRFGPGGPTPEGELRRKDLTLEDAEAPPGVPEMRAVSPAAVPLEQQRLSPEVPRRRSAVTRGSSASWRSTRSRRTGSSRSAAS